ncbi:MAG: alcohol dehydrogenase catalytic domain-containing protein [Anaerolineaceae bacterium]|jgi:L-iditol 2-dehydrogenase
MKAIRLIDRETLTVEDIPMPELKPGWALVEMKHAIICGSDKRWYKVGAHKMPLTLGHELAGIVRKVEGDPDSGLLNKRVSIIPLMNCGECPACMSGAYNLCPNYKYLGSSFDGGFAEFVAVPVQNIVLVPETLNLSSVAAVDPYAVGLHALRRGNYRAGQSAVVIGAGTIGLTATDYLLNVLGALDVTVADVVPEKLRIAEKLGAKSLDLSKNPNLDDYLADIVLVATAAPSSIGNALFLAKRGGTVTVAGIPYNPVELAAKNFEQLMRREIKMMGCWNYVWSAMPENEWNTTIQFLASGKLHPELLITHHFSLDDGAKGFETALHDPNAVMVEYVINQ